MVGSYIFLLKKIKLNKIIKNIIIKYKLLKGKEGLIMTIILTNY